MQYQALLRNPKIHVMQKLMLAQQTGIISQLQFTKTIQNFMARKMADLQEDPRYQGLSHAKREALIEKERYLIILDVQNRIKEIAKRKFEPLQSD